MGSFAAGHVVGGAGFAAAARVQSTEWTYPPTETHRRRAACLELPPRRVDGRCRGPT
ncbi:hypothetical protein FRAHR75_650034 [Frankia sp. Hr75.2]|nr:hypothetical protein FRAHR75_650034 [Frankia sp. Hr75.2]SQD94496.1 hypothetical protein FMEAI12_2600012 [Parafrankia sp. Ea1.12]